MRVMFCPTDKGLLRPVDGVLTCPKCGYKKGQGESPSMVVKGKAADDTRKSVVIDEATQEKEKGLLPTATYICEKCGHDKAYYFFRQTRAADEATTRFLECVGCGHKWRDYR